jgi:hypothetical protein
MQYIKSNTSPERATDQSTVSSCAYQTSFVSRPFRALCLFARLHRASPDAKVCRPFRACILWNYVCSNASAVLRPVLGRYVCAVR